MFENLFKPIRIGPVEIKNRVALAPLNVRFSENHFVSEQDICYMLARAKGGTGLLFTGAIITSRAAAKYHSGVIHHLFEWVHLPGFQEMAEAVHEHDAKLFLQLSPGFGRRACPPRTGELVAPSPIPEQYYPQLRPNIFHKFADRYVPFIRGSGPPIPREITIEEILELEEDTAYSAMLALYSGADGIELHSCHGYLIHQFLSPRSNKRTDSYGGTLENRMRFLLELVMKTKAAVGDQIPVGVRLSCSEHIPGGLTLDDSLAIAKACENEGADFIDLSDGTVGENMKFFLPEDDLHIPEEAKEFKREVKVTVITPSVHNPGNAEAVIAAGKTDMIALGRQLLADPEWVNKVKEGRVDEILRCLRDNECIITAITEGRLRCIVNPNCGREKYMPEYWPQRKSTKIPEGLLKRKN